MSDTSISSLIALLARRHRTLAAELIEPFDLAPGQESLLMLLAREEPLSQAQIARTLGIEPATVTKMVERMERNGLIERSRSAEDKRIVLVTRSDLARDRQPDLVAAWARLDQITLQGFSPEASHHLSTLLRSVLDNVERAQDDPAAREAIDASSDQGDGRSR